MNGNQRTNINLSNGDSTFNVELTDIYGYKYTESKTLSVNSSSTNTVGSNIIPTITTINPKDRDSRISLYAGDSFNLRFSISVGTDVREVSIFLDNTSIQNATAGDVFVIPVGTSGLTPGIHALRISLIDGNMKTAERRISVNVLPK